LLLPLLLLLLLLLLLFLLLLLADAVALALALSPLCYVTGPGNLLGNRVEGQLISWRGYPF
jgi:hypothetical protein